MSGYYDLGKFSRVITTPEPDAQLWFDRGYLWTIAFNHEEAVNCFRRALEHDPECAMAWWGVAYASGNNYNKPWEAFDAKDAKRSLAAAFDATEEAMSLLENTSKVEQALINTLPLRYPERNIQEITGPWNDQYATAMRLVYQDYPEDPDIAALFAEALMNRTPWALWDLKTGLVADGADTLEAVEVLQAALEHPDAMAHPGVLHMYIHLMEMSPHPERALKAADALRGLAPDAGHLQHMPTHIDVLCGHYERVVTSNHDAIVADRKFLERKGAENFYSLYRCHNYHFKIYGAMFLGQYQPAIETAEELNSTLSISLLRLESPPMADWLEGFISMKQHVYIRFGKWQEIIDQSIPRRPKLFCVTTAMMHYAKSVAYAATGNVESAEEHAQKFDSAVGRVPESRVLFNNTCLSILSIAREMMLGEIDYRKGNFEAAFTHLRRSVKLDDNLPYDEPWGWMQPARHALGALLLEQGHIEEAAAVYRADLGLDDTLSRACRHPDNVWSLKGYHECLMHLGNSEEANIIGQKLQIAQARTDIDVRSSCYCKQGS